MATLEDATWESGKCSGTMYCGDHDHYDFMNQAFGLFAHVNVLQRDMCPSATKFEAEILAMTLDLLHGEAVTGTTPGGIVTTGGTGSICHAMLAYREHAAGERGVTRPNVIKPETAHPAFDKACHLFGIELRRAPVDPVTTRWTSSGWPTTSTTRRWPSSARPATTATAPSTPSPSSPTWPSSAASASTWTAAWAASSSRSARSSATTSRSSTTACPGSPPSRPTPTSTATPSRAPPPSPSGTRRCATRSTSS